VVERFGWELQGDLPDAIWQQLEARESEVEGPSRLACRYDGDEVVAVTLHAGNNGLRETVAERFVEAVFGDADSRTLIVAKDTEWVKKYAMTSIDSVTYISPGAVFVSGPTKQVGGYIEREATLLCFEVKNRLLAIYQIDEGEAGRAKTERVTIVRHDRLESLTEMFRETRNHVRTWIKETIEGTSPKIRKERLFWLRVLTKRDLGPTRDAWEEWLMQDGASMWQPPMREERELGEEEIRMAFEAFGPPFKWGIGVQSGEPRDALVKYLSPRSMRVKRFLASGVSDYGTDYLGLTGDLQALLEGRLHGSQSAFLYVLRNPDASPIPIAKIADVLGYGSPRSESYSDSNGKNRMAPLLPKHIRWHRYPGFAYGRTRDDVEYLRLTIKDRAY